MNATEEVENRRKDTHNDRADDFETLQILIRKGKYVPLIHSMVPPENTITLINRLLQKTQILFA